MLWTIKNISNVMLLTVIRRRLESMSKYQEVKVALFNVICEVNITYFFPEIIHLHVILV